MSHMRKNSFFYGPYSFLTQRSIGLSNAKQDRLLSHRLYHAKNLFRRDLRAHFGCVNAIEFSRNGGEWISSGGDDRRVLLWNVEKAIDSYKKPACMKGEHHSNIFCLAFDNSNKKIFSGGNDEQVIVHDTATGESIDVFLHEDAVYGLSVDPVNDNVFASACDDGRVLLYDLRAPPDEDPFCLARYNYPMHAVMFNPAEPRLVATANSREGLSLWDVRKPRSSVIRYGGSLCQQSCMSVRINATGDKVIGLRRRLPPVLYNLQSPQTLCQFDHSGYYNSCTMKSCCFAGDKDQYIISGSDDFNLYIWKIPEEGCSDWVADAHLVLKGHRSIVNQVRFNPANHMIMSSGVEKVVKVWSPFPLTEGSGNLGLCPNEERPVYTHEEYINLVLRSGQLMTHDYTNESMDEDPRMMAFFDSLVQRELEGWSSEDSLDSSSPIHNDYIHSETSSPSSPTITTEQMETLASDAVLRFFSPMNALTNRIPGQSTPFNTPATTDSNIQADNNLLGETNTMANQDGSPASVLLDMDRQPVNRHSNNSSTTVLVIPETRSRESVATNGTSTTAEATAVATTAAKSTAAHNGEQSVNETENQDSNHSVNGISDNANQSAVCDLSSNMSDRPVNPERQSVNNETGNHQLPSDISSNSYGLVPVSSQQTSSRPSNLVETSLEQNNHSDGTSLASFPEGSGIRSSTPSTSEGVNNSNNERGTIRSISELIKNKRKEYLAGIEKFKKKAEKRRMVLKERRKEKYKRIKLKLLPDEPDDESDDSSSSDSSSESVSSSSSSSSSESSPGDTGKDILNEIMEKRRSVLSRLQNFKKLRSQMANKAGSDNDSDSKTDVDKKTLFGENAHSSNNLSDASVSNQNLQPNKAEHPQNILPIYDDISNDSCELSSTIGKEPDIMENDTSRNIIETNSATNVQVVKCNPNNGATNSSSVESVNGKTVIYENNDSCTSPENLPCNGINANSTNHTGLVPKQSDTKSVNINTNMNALTNNTNDENPSNGQSSSSAQTCFKKLGTSKHKQNRRNYRRHDSSDIE